MADLGEDQLAAAGLEYLGTKACGVDEVDYWSKAGSKWPTTELEEWP